MADGELILKLDDDLVRKIEDGAAAAGMTPANFAQHLLEQQLFNYDDYDWDRDPREREPDFDPSELTVPLEEALAIFNAEFEKRMAARR